jgi:hypothetical protein
VELFDSSLYCVGATDRQFRQAGPYRRPLQESPRQANPSHCEGIAGHLDSAPPSNGSFTTSGISTVSRRCPSIRLPVRQAPRSPCNAGGLLTH